MIDIRSARLRVLMLAMASIAIFAIAACGSSDDGGDDGGSDPTATTQSNGSDSPTATSQSGSQPTATATTIGGFGDFDDFLDNACSYIELAVDLPDAVLDASASDEPSSATTRDIANYFANVIEDALGSGTPTCYLEFNDDGDFGMWVAFDLDGDAPSNAADLLKDELIDRGVDEGDVEAFSLTFGGAGFNSVTATNVDILGQYSDGEVTLFVSGDNVVLAVEDDGSFSSSTATPFPGLATSTPGSSNSPTSTPAPTAQTSGAATEVDDILKPLLEDALGVELNLASSTSFSGQGTTSVLLSYEMATEPTVNLLSKLTAVVESLNGTVLFSGSFGGSTSVSFAEVLIGDAVFSGAFAVVDGTVTFTGQSDG